MKKLNKKISSRQKVLVVVAHEDDETLGMGGTIWNHIQSGDEVYCIAMTDGVSARSVSSSSSKLRTNAANEAAKVLGFNWLRNEQFPDNRMDSVDLLDICKIIENYKDKLNPQIVYTHSFADLNVDHKKVCQAVLTAFRPQPNESWLEIRTFEIPSATDFGHPSVTGVFNPNLFINISSSWAKKEKALKKYHLEMRNSPHSRSFEGLENLARLRGMQVGLPMAEAFEVLRKIIR